MDCNIKPVQKYQRSYFLRFNVMFILQTFFSMECDRYDSSWDINVVLHFGVCVCCYLFILYKTFEISSHY